MAKGQKRAGPVQYITLPDGRKIPYAIPSHLPPDVAAAIVEQLRANPEQALLAFQNAQAIARDKDLTEKYLGLMKPATQGQQPVSPQQQQIFDLLRNDPEFKDIFDEVQAEGPQALMKHMENQELMLKVSKKLREAGLAAGGVAAAPVEAGAEAAAEEQAKPAAPATKGEPENAFEAAKAGDTRKVAQYLDEGADINGKNDKGVPLLGLAVGFNQKGVVELLIERGVNLESTDNHGNTAIHYAAGYGRKDIAELLVKAGANLGATNKAEQTPLDAARTNGETTMVHFLDQRSRLHARLQQRASERARVPKPASAKKASAKAASAAAAAAPQSVESGTELVVDMSDAALSKKNAVEVEELLSKLGLS